MSQKGITWGLPRKYLGFTATFLLKAAANYPFIGDTTLALVFLARHCFPSSNQAANKAADKATNHAPNQTTNPALNRA